MKDVLEWLLPLAGGSAISVLAIVGGVWGLKRLVEWGLADALSKGLEDHKAAIAKDMAEQQRSHEAKLEALRSELRAVESEAADLRAHSLGLEAERQKRFEDRRKDAVENCYAQLVEGLHETTRLLSALEHPDETERVSTALVRAAETLVEVRAAGLAAGLYLSPLLSVQLEEFVRELFAPVADGEDSGVDWEAWGRQREVQLRTLCILLRAELGYDKLSPAPSRVPAQDEVTNSRPRLRHGHGGTANRATART